MVGLAFFLIFAAVLVVIVVAGAHKGPSKEGVTTPTGAQSLTVSVASLPKGHALDKCDDYAITATHGLTADRAWADSFAESANDGGDSLPTSCTERFPTTPVLGTCTVHISAHVDGDSGVELGTYEIDQVRRYYRADTIKSRDAHTTGCPDMKGEWQAAAIVDKNLDLALHLVKKAVLTVDNRRSSMDVEDNISFLIGGPSGLKASKGWSASKESGSKYLVSYSFINGAREDLATWEADLSTNVVRYVNENAKVFSWVPAE